MYVTSIRILFGRFRVHRFRRVGDGTVRVRVSQMRFNEDLRVLFPKL